jgi:hypothetical protein
MVYELSRLQLINMHIIYTPFLLGRNLPELS